MLATSYRKSGCYITNQCLNCLYKLLNLCAVVILCTFMHLVLYVLYMLYMSLFKFCFKLLKYIDLMNLENAYEYFVTESQLVGQVPPPVLILCFKFFLCLSSILQSYEMLCCLSSLIARAHCIIY
jgi:hypothetical protein